MGSRDRHEGCCLGKAGMNKPHIEYGIYLDEYTEVQDGPLAYHLRTQDTRIDEPWRLTHTNKALKTRIYEIRMLI